MDYRFKTDRVADLQEAYQSTLVDVINKGNRYRRLLDISAPEKIMEKELEAFLLAAVKAFIVEGVRVTEEGTIYPQSAYDGLDVEGMKGRMAFT
ncbi:MAG: hypothetical protein AVO39_08790 [delta proteobacterium MLS_D]|nr:MAG: hypothetical protein AVO39_08790 [delta proteobacterium MLS_D]